MFKTKNSKKIQAFTLIELLVVISIISLLSSIVLASLAGARDAARYAKVQLDVRQIINGVELFASDNGGKYPREGGAYGNNGWNRPDCSSTRNSEDTPNGLRISSLAGWTNTAGNRLDSYFAGGDFPVDPWNQDYILDALYNCSVGSQKGFENQTSGSWVWAIHSEGANKSGTNIYDSDNLAVIICDHPG